MPAHADESGVLLEAGLGVARFEAQEDDIGVALHGAAGGWLTSRLAVVGRLTACHAYSPDLLLVVGPHGIVRFNDVLWAGAGIGAFIWLDSYTTFHSLDPAVEARLGADLRLSGASAASVSIDYMASSIEGLGGIHRFMLTLGYRYGG